jgi:2-dehydropantoate 2-reductase
MKTLIVGTGIIGTLYGWALSEAGVDVTHFVRPGMAAKFQDGVQLDVLDERRAHKKQNVTTYLLRCAEQVTEKDGYELVIVPTNAYQLEEALRALAPSLGQAGFLTFAANWQGSDFIDALLPPWRYVMGYPDGGGTFQDGVYWTNLGAQPHLGALDPAANGLLERVQALFVKADMQPDVPPNILHWLWLHNATTTPFWVGAARYRHVEPFLRDRTLVQQCYAASREVIELCRLRGVDVDKYPEVSSFNLPGWLFFILFRFLYATNASMQRYTAHAMQSLREAKFNYRSILETGPELGYTMPNLAGLGICLQDIT